MDDQNQTNDLPLVSGSIRRAKHDKEHPFVMISRAMFRDKSISPKAKGILGYLLSLPDGWVVKTINVEKELVIGRDYLRSGLKELIKAGYCKAEKIKDSSGQYIRIDYEFSEEPIFKNTVPQTGNPSPVSQEKPETGNPSPANPPPKNIDIYKEKREEYAGEISPTASARSANSSLSFDWSVGKFKGLEPSIREGWASAFPLVPLDSFIPFMEQKIFSQPARYQKRKQWLQLALEFLVREQQSLASRAATKSYDSPKKSKLRCKADERPDDFDYRSKLYNG